MAVVPLATLLRASSVLASHTPVVLSGVAIP